MLIQELIKSAQANAHDEIAAMVDEFIEICELDALEAKGLKLLITCVGTKYTQTAANAVFDYMRMRKDLR